MSQLEQPMPVGTATSGDPGRRKPQEVADERAASPLCAGKTGWMPLGIGLLVLAVLAAVCTVVWIRFGGRILWPKIQDDAYYYYIVAYNVTHGNGLTLDGLNWTNGFHPLWFLVVLPIFAVAQIGSHGGMLAVHVLSVTVYSATVVLLVDTLIRMGTGRFVAGLMGLACLFAPFISHAASGMESVLTVPLLILVIRRVAANPQVLRPFGPPTPAREGVLLGCLLGLVMLSRLDCVFMLLAVAGYVCLTGLAASQPWSERLVRTAKRCLVIFGPVCAMVVPYLLWNLAQTGHLVPISGALKSSFPHPRWNGEYLREFAHWFVLLVPMAAWALLSLLRGSRDPGHAAHRAALLPLIVGAFLHAGYTLVFCKFGVQGWHFAQYIPVAVISGGLLLEFASRLSVRRPALRRTFLGAAAAGILAVVAFSLMVSVRKVTREGFRTAAFDAAIWARANTPPDALFAMTDCGVFTYYSRRRCVNLDGIINSWAFQEVLAGDRLARFFAETPVDYLVVHRIGRKRADYRNMDLSFRSHLYDGRVSAIRVTRRQEVYRSGIYPEDDGSPGFLAVWRLGEAGGSEAALRR